MTDLLDLQKIARFSQDRTQEPNMPTRSVGRDDGR